MRLYLHARLAQRRGGDPEALGLLVVELGLLNHSIHQVNENTPVADLLELSKIYERIMELLLL